MLCFERRDVILGAIGLLRENYCTNKNSRVLIKAQMMLP